MTACRRAPAASPRSTWPSSSSASPGCSENGWPCRRKSSFSAGSSSPAWPWARSWPPAGAPSGSRRGETSSSWPSAASSWPRTGRCSSDPSRSPLSPWGFSPIRASRSSRPFSSLSWPARDGTRRASSMPCSASSGSPSSCRASMSRTRSSAASSGGSGPGCRSPSYPSWTGRWRPAIPSLTVAFYQDLVAAVVLAPAVLRAGLPRSGRDWALIAVLGIVCTAAAHTLFIEGMKGVGARTASVLSSLEPVYGIILALALLNESPSLRTVSGGAIVLAAALAATVRAARRA